jgi:hypothetical protein
MAQLDKFCILVLWNNGVSLWPSWRGGMNKSNRGAALAQLMLMQRAQEDVVFEVL